MSNHLVVLKSSCWVHFICHSASIDRALQLVRKDPVYSRDLMKYQICMHTVIHDPWMPTYSVLV